MRSSQAERTETLSRRARPPALRRLAVRTVASGALGVLCAAGVLLTPPMVPISRFSFPFDSTWFVVTQLLFAAQHLLMLAGVLGLAALVTPPTRVWRPALALAGGGFVLLTGCELFGLLAATAAEGSAVADAVSTAYGLPTVLVGVGFVLVGWVVARQQQLGAGRWLPLAFGLYVFVVLIPALVGPDAAGRVALGGWMMLYLLLGVVLWRRGSA